MYLSKISKSGKVEKVPVYAQLYPNAIPSLKNKVSFLETKPTYYTFENLVDINNFINLNNSEVLDEIQIKAKTERDRIEKIRNSAFGRLKFLNDFDRTTTLAFYLNGQAGIRAEDDLQNGVFRISTREGVPAIYLNDFFSIDYSIYFLYYLDFVEYIEINTLGLAPSGFKGGTIKIYENYKKFKNYRKTLSKIDFPVTFTKPKKFYIPEYANYKNNFFKNYGVLDWLPKNKISESGNLNLAFNSKNAKEVVLFIEGINENGDFILDEKIIKID